MTQTYGPKFRVPKQYLKRAVVIVLPQVTSPQSPHYSSVLFEVYSVSIYSVSNIQFLDSAE